jgi:hypothetical protein
MNNYISLITELKIKSVRQMKFETAAEYREIEALLYHQTIEEIFKNKNSYNDIVVKNIEKIIRLKKLKKLNDH